MRLKGRKRWQERKEGGEEVMDRGVREMRRKVSADYNVTPQRRGGDSMETQRQTTRGEGAQERENEIWKPVRVSTSPLYVL